MQTLGARRDVAKVVWRHVCRLERQFVRPNSEIGQRMCRPVLLARVVRRMLHIDQNLTDRHHKRNYGFAHDEKTHCGKDRQLYASTKDGRLRNTAITHGQAVRDGMARMDISTTRWR